MNIQSSGFALARDEARACEDAWSLRERNGVLVAALADGVGSAGEAATAANRAVEMLVDYCLSRPRAWSPRRALAEFTSQINRHLHSESMERHGQPELACTLSAVLIEGGRLYGCNVGDSPVFHWRRGRLQRLSETHTLAGSNLDHVLTRALGLEATVEPYLFELELADGDVVLLCSDGVSAALSDERLNELLSRRSAARSVVATARTAVEETDVPRDDTSAVVLEVIDRGHSVSEARQRLDVVRVLRPGDTFDGHRLVRPLAAGDRVWLAENGSGTRVVLKFPPLEAAENEAIRDAFIREAWNAARLASPDLVRSWTPDGGPLRYYGMDYVDAPTLRTLLRSGPLTVEDTRELGQFLLRIGQFLLQHDLVHGDIKPDNILVRRDVTGTAFRLLDLGSAAEVFSVTSRAGTASYLAPERFRGGALSERTEIFAIGVTLYEALTGTYPYGEVERFQTPRFDVTVRHPARLNAAVPPWLGSIVLRAIDPDPERRYQHFSELAYDLAHPARVSAHHRKDAALLERNPLLFYQLLCGGLCVVVIWLLTLLARRAG